MVRKRVGKERGSPFANRESSAREPLFAEMRDWCRGKWWFPRLVVIGWFAHLWVQLIQNPGHESIFFAINLGIHEAGHILWSPFGEFMMFLGGSLTQCLAPIAAMVVFYRQSDYFGIAFSFGWLSTNLYNVSVYVADARSQGLALVSPFGPDPMHDWHYLLGRMGLLEYDKTLAGLTVALAFVCMLTFMVAGAYQTWLMISLPAERERIGVRGFDDEDQI